MSAGPTGAAVAGPADLPTTDEQPEPSNERIAERVEDFYEKYPMKANTFLVHDGGDDPREPRVRLREEVVETLEGGDNVPVTWGGALWRRLEWYADRRGTRGRFSNGEGESFEKPLLNSYEPEYLEKYYARLMALHREVAGGERPTGGWTDGEYENPVAAMVTLTSSGVDRMNRPRGPVDHQLERREAWPATYKRMYDRMEGLRDGGVVRDWCYVIVEEHHPGRGYGLNGGYGHDHVVIIVDLAGGHAEVETALRSVVGTWISECPGAEIDAHDQDHPNPEKRPIDIREVDGSDMANPDVMNSTAGYLTKYLYPEDGELDDLERSVEQLAHHTVKWATNTRRVRKSDAAGRAIRADRCKQAHDRGDQNHAHGERLARSSGRGPDVVCAECESAWGVPEAETIVEARRGNVAGDPDVKSVTPNELSTDARALPDRWPEATAAASTEAEGFERDEPDGWRLEAVIVKDGEAEGGEREVAPSPGGASVPTLPVRGIEQVSLTDLGVDERRERDRLGWEPPDPEPVKPDRWGRLWHDRSPAHDAYSQKGRATMIRRAVDELEGERAALITDVVDRVEGSGVDPDLAGHMVQKMVERGELYKPSGARVRVT